MVSGWQGSRRKVGEGEMNGESSLEAYTTICKIDSQWKFAVTQGIQTGAL